MNTRLTIASSFLLAFIATSCTDSGYESYDECLLTEMQKCSSNCKREAKNFCENKNGKQYSKAVREIWQKNSIEDDIKLRARCKDLRKEEAKGVKINPYFFEECWGLDGFKDNPLKGVFKDNS